MDDNIPYINDSTLYDWEDVKEKTYSSIFTLESTYNIWPQINMIRTQFNFQDKISDKDMIEENKWAIQQYRKFVSTKESEFKKVWDDRDKVLDLFDKTYNDLKDDFVDRKNAIYQTLRDNWIIRSVNLILNTSKIYGGE